MLAERTCEMVASAKRLRLTPNKERNQAPRMGEIQQFRKRHRSDYMKVGDDIEFKIVTKRQRLDSCGEESSSEDRSSPDLMQQIKDISISEKSGKAVKQAVKVKDIVKKVEESVRPASPEKVTMDTRELNRRSPNGFLLPDPLPK